MMTNIIIIMMMIHQRMFILIMTTSRSGKGYAEDYYLDAKSQCAGRRGACPDKWVRNCDHDDDDDDEAVPDKEVKCS